jgi:hypothetical protein
MPTLRELFSMSEEDSSSDSFQNTQYVEEPPPNPYKNAIDSHYEMMLRSKATDWTYEDSTKVVLDMVRARQGQPPLYNRDTMVFGGRGRGYKYPSSSRDE